MAENGVGLTLAEAATPGLLIPAVTEDQLREIIHALRASPKWKPVGSRRNGRRGHPHSTYRWSEIVLLHGALLPWLEKEVP